MRSLTVVVLWNCVLIASAQRGMANCPDPAIPCDARFPGDLDQDGDVDRDDYSSFNGCISGPSGGPLSPDCQASDLTGDDDNDLEDMAAFQRRFTGGCDCPPLIQEPPNGQPGNPMRTVYLFSGEFQERLVDLRIKGRGVLVQRFLRRKLRGDSVRRTTDHHDEWLPSRPMKRVIRQFGREDYGHERAGAHFRRCERARHV